MKIKTLIKSVLILLVTCSVALAGWKETTVIGRGATRLEAYQAASDLTKSFTSSSYYPLYSSYRQDGNGKWVYEMKFKYEVR